LFLKMSPAQKSLALMKYVFKKNLNYVILKETTLSSMNLSLFFKFGFVFIYKLYNNRFMVLNIMFNSKPLISSVTLFTKKSNKIVLSKKMTLNFLFLNPSLFLLTSRNGSILLDDNSDFLRNRIGTQLLGFIV